MYFNLYIELSFLSTWVVYNSGNILFFQEYLTFKRTQGNTMVSTLGIKHEKRASGF